MTKKNIWTLLLAASSLLAFANANAAELKLKNGVSFIAEHDTRSPRDLVMLSFLGGNGLIKADEQGSGRLLSEVLDEGPVGITTVEFRKKLFLLGAEIGFTSNARSTSVIVVAPAANLDAALALALETLQKPKFDDATYQFARSKVEAGLAQREDDMASTIRYVSVRDAYAYHPDVLDGTPSRLSLKNVNLKTLQKSFPILYDKRYLMLAAVGPTEPATLQKTVEARLSAAGFLADKVLTRNFKSARADQKPKGPVKVTLINKPGATDNQLRYLLRRNLPIDNMESVALNLSAKLLGGGMQSSLFRVLRGERGLTYSAGAGVNDNLGYLTVASFASTDKLGKLMSGVSEVVSAQAKVVVDKSNADLVKGDMLTEWKESRELPSDRLSSDVAAKIYGRDPSFEETLDQWIAKTPETALTAAEQKYFDLKNAYVYVMGDKTKLLPILKTLGYKTNEIKVVEPAAVL